LRAKKRNSNVIDGCVPFSSFSHISNCNSGGNEKNESWMALFFFSIPSYQYIF
jgi:hypothetical protein